MQPREGTRTISRDPPSQSNRQVQLGPLLHLPLATPVTKHRPLQEGSPALADPRSWLFQHFCAGDPWKQPAVGHAAQLAPCLLPGHLIHPLPTPPQAAPARPKQTLTEHFSAQHPLTLGAFSLCLFFCLFFLCFFFFSLPFFGGCDFNCVHTVPDKPCPGF